jgi:hypothetical protein
MSRAYSAKADKPSWAKIHRCPLLSESDPNNGPSDAALHADSQRVMESF